jgi:hypothetical protein
MKGSQESLSTAVVKSGLAARDNLSSVGSHQESWATPQSRDFRSAEGNADRWENPERSRNLNDQMKTWATPAARDWKGQSSSPGYQKQDLNDQIKAWSTPNAMKLNPRWVETLMGLPVGWVMPSCVNPITPKSEPTQESPLPATGNWPTASTMDVITPTRDLTQMESKGHWGKQPRQRPDGIGFIAPNTGKLSEMVHYTSPVTIEPTNCDCLGTESSQQPLNSHSELFGRN